MISKEIMDYSLRNLWKRKSRSFLTILSIFIGIATIFIFISFGLGLFNYIQEMTESSSVDKIIVQPRGSGAPGLDTTFQLTEDDLSAVKRTTGVYNAAGANFKVAKVLQRNELKYVFLTSYDPKNPLIMDIFNIDIIQGRGLQSGDQAKVVLGYSYLIKDKIFPKAYELNDEITIQDRKLKIVGFFEEVGNPQDDSNVYITTDFEKDLYGESETKYSWIVASVDIGQIDAVTERIEKSVRNSRNIEEGEEDFFVQSFRDLIDTYSNILNMIIGFVVLIALISVLVSAINTANTMITSVLERTKEIGIIKSIGAKNSEIFKLFLFESSLLGFVAGCVGVLIGFLLSYIGGQLLQNLGWGFLAPDFSPYLFLGCIVFAVLTGAVSGVLPAIRASKTNIVDALRYE